MVLNIHNHRQSDTSQLSQKARKIQQFHDVLQGRLTQLTNIILVQPQSIKQGNIKSKRNIQIGESRLEELCNAIQKGSRNLDWYFILSQAEELAELCRRVINENNNRQSFIDESRFWSKRNPLSIQNIIIQVKRDSNTALSVILKSVERSHQYSDSIAKNAGVNNHRQPREQKNK
jgi:hypothetical protein